MLRMPNLLPSKWCMARVLECYPGADGCVRVVKVKTSISVYERPITELVLLPIDVTKCTESEKTAL